MLIGRAYYYIVIGLKLFILFWGRLKEIGLAAAGGSAGDGAGSIASGASATGLVTAALADNTAGVRRGVLWNNGIEVEPEGLMLGVFEDIITLYAIDCWFHCRGGCHYICTHSSGNLRVAIHG
jgi:hypothetical protein